VQPPNAAPVELNEFERSHRSPSTTYVSGLVKAADIAETLIPTADQTGQLSRTKIPAKLQWRRDEIRVLAVKVLGSPREAEHWLETPMKFAFDDQRPRELLQTLEGCDKVEQLLKTLYS
jgi:uncharacterized protein (DUF2384 family)